MELVSPAKAASLSDAMLAKTWVLLAVAIAASACDGETEAGDGKIESTSPDLYGSIIGEHLIDGAYINTSTHDPTGVPAGMYAPHRAKASILVSTLSGSKFAVSFPKDGLKFTAELADGMLESQGVEATIDPNGNASKTGWVGETLQDFRWDVASGSYQAVGRIVTAAGWGGPAYTFIDVRDVNVDDPTHSWVHYRADTSYPWDFPHGEECLLGGGTTAEGFLGLTYGETHNELSVYLQGIGCSITASSEDGKVFSANSTECPLEPVMSIASLGIKSFTFETFSLDVEHKHVSFLARATRLRDDGVLVDLCLQLDSDLDGDMPQ